MRVAARSGFASEPSFRGIQCWIGFYSLCRSIARIHHLVSSFDSAAGAGGVFPEPRSGSGLAATAALQGRAHPDRAGLPDGTRDRGRRGTCDVRLPGSGVRDRPAAPLLGAGPCSAEDRTTPDRHRGPYCGRPSYRGSRAAARGRAHPDRVIPVRGLNLNGWLASRCSVGPSSAPNPLGTRPKTP